MASKITHPNLRLKIVKSKSPFKNQKFIFIMHKHKISNFLHIQISIKNQNPTNLNRRLKFVKFCQLKYYKI